MSTVREHLGLLWLLRHKLQTKNPNYDRHWEMQAALFSAVHLDDLITLAGGADIEDTMRKHFPEVPTDFPHSVQPPTPTTPPAALAVQGEPVVPSFECSLASTDAYDPQSFINGAKWAQDRLLATPAVQAQEGDVRDAVLALRVAFDKVEGIAVRERGSDEHVRAANVYQCRVAELVSAALRATHPEGK